MRRLSMLVTEEDDRSWWTKMSSLNARRREWREAHGNPCASTENSMFIFIEISSRNSQSAVRVCEHLEIVHRSFLYNRKSVSLNNISRLCFLYDSSFVLVAVLLTFLRCFGVKSNI
ncbi:hypothetical protein VPH35_113998 [Triticum aestivum]